MRSEWLTYQGHRLFFCNYAQLTLENLKVEMAAVDAFIGQQPEGSVLILTDVRGLVGSPQVLDLFKQSTSHTKKYIRRSAVVGIGFSGPKKVLFDMVMRFSGQNVVVFEDPEKAKDWLVAN
jgi:hypothetical protein